MLECLYINETTNCHRGVMCARCVPAGAVAAAARPARHRAARRPPPPRPRRRALCPLRHAPRRLMKQSLRPVSYVGIFYKYRFTPLLSLSHLDSWSPRFMELICRETWFQRRGAVGTSSRVGAAASVSPCTTRATACRSARTALTKRPSSAVRLPRPAPRLQPHTSRCTRYVVLERSP